MKNDNNIIVVCQSATVGATLDEAIEKCNEMVYDWIYIELTEGGMLPGKTVLEDMELKEGDIVRNISVNIRFTDGWDE